MALFDAPRLLPFATDFPALLKDRAVAELNVLIDVTKAVIAVTSSSQRGRPPACFACDLWISGVSKASLSSFILDRPVTSNLEKRLAAE